VGGEWNYLKYKNVPALLSSFEKTNYETVGFFGAFGRSEKQRHFLGKMDAKVKFLISISKRYVLFGVAEKK
jgi:hypothetical protein